MLFIRVIYLTILGSPEVGTSQFGHQHFCIENWKIRNMLEIDCISLPVLYPVCPILHPLLPVKWCKCRHRSRRQWNKRSWSRPRRELCWFSHPIPTQGPADSINRILSLRNVLLRVLIFYDYLAIFYRSFLYNLYYSLLFHNERKSTIIQKIMLHKMMVYNILYSLWSVIWILFISVAITWAY